MIDDILSPCPECGAKFSDTCRCLIVQSPDDVREPEVPNAGGGDECPRNTETDLTEEELRVWIAEKCGWKRPDHPDCMVKKKGWARPRKWWMHPQGELALIQDIPHYTRDLNAVFTAEQKLTSAQLSIFQDALLESRGQLSEVAFPADRWIGHTTALQRAKAFYLATK